ncbi:glycosyltransferase involved in cell wall biosynthesis [Rhizobium petrolearium]|uniref:glycosyltransferase family 4 protein n=1 Tax=Neorhizobium petrolearium TaxID=515361 RepID=UPI001F349A31|nr:glycosyltransferase family 4 protein [Neorhizobium petrolearium]MBP1844103.1 glycosyltransferase involved in cell wall biosynthesis [Neorhizobium petrolearium]
MKIIFLNRYFFPDQSATSRMTTSIALALVQRGFDVMAVASREIHNQRTTSLPADEVIAGVQVKRLATFRFGRHTVVGRAIDYLCFHVLAFFWLLRNVSAGDMTVVCTDPPFLSVTSAVALRLKGGIMVNWIMDLFPETAVELGFFRRWRLPMQFARKARNWSLNSPGITVCSTSRMATYVEQQGLPRDHLTIMHHWSDDEEIYPIPPSRNRLRSQWGLSGTFVVGYSGNFGRAHEFQTIIDAARRLKDRDDIRFLLIGGGHQHAAVMEAAQQFQLDNMIFKPLQPIANLSESLNAADVHLVSLLPELEHCIVPSKFYGILAAGRPTIFIGDQDGEVPRALASNGCGRSVEIGAVDDLTATICDMRNSPELRTEMGQKARQLLLKEYSRERAIDAWCALITRVRNASPSVSPLAQGISP